MHQRLKEKFEDKQIRYIMAQVVLAVHYLHGKQIIHKNISPDKIYFDEHGYIILIMDTHKEVQHTFFGKKSYQGPEVTQKKCLKKSVDIWSLGMLLYELYCGFPAFFGSHQFDNYENNMVLYPNKQKHGIELPIDAVDLIDKLLEKKPDERISINEVMSHWYFWDIDFEKLLHKKLKLPFAPGEAVVLEGDLTIQAVPLERSRLLK